MEDTLFPFLRKSFCSETKQESVILEEVLRRIQKHTDADRDDITVDTGLGYEKCCDCERTSYFVDGCIHGIPFSKNVLKVRIFLKGWDFFSFEKDLICSWREIKYGKETRIYPFRFQESFVPKKALSRIFAVIGKKNLVEFRKKKTTQCKKQLKEALQQLNQSNKKVQTLELENEKFRQLLAELYAPGGTLAEEARKEYETLSQQGN
nr:hypothetical protein [Marseillevirus cajuinensis]